MRLSIELTELMELPHFDTGIELKVQSALLAGRQLIVVVLPDRDKSRAASGYLAQALEYPLVRLGLALSRRLIEVLPRRRPAEVLVAVRQIVEAQKSGVVVLDTIEVLFDQQLRQDPLGLLANVARNTRLVVMWPGAADGGNLSYAQPGHVEYRHYAQAELRHNGVEVILKEDRQYQ